MSKKFNIVKSYYDKGLWTSAMVKAAVGRWITAEECAAILGES